MYNKFLRNINSVGTTDQNIINEFNYQLGVRYQLMLAKLQNYKTYLSYNFQTGMNLTLVSSGVSQSIDTITSSSTTATVTTAEAHGLSTSNVVTISGVSPSAYNGTFTITVTSTTEFTYTLTQDTNNVAGTSSQYYPYPPGYVNADGITITVGSVNFPLKIIDSEYLWEQLNAILIQASALPQFYFPRRDDFGIWPIPQATYSGTIYYHYRDRNLNIADYQTGTIAISNGSYTVTGTTTEFTRAMIGRWFTIDDPTVYGQGYWYRIVDVPDSTHLTLYQPYQGDDASGISLYRVAQTPELPEDGHMSLVDGATAGFYTDFRKDLDNGSLFDNKFWTGDANNKNRQIGTSAIAGGLIGLMNRYQDREDTKVIVRKPGLNPLQYQVWATTLSNS